jgi:hypothetical protein
MWNDIKDWFKDSETIFWARFQMLVGAVIAVLVSTDLSPLLSAGVPTTQQLIFAGVVFGQGVLTEYLRRRRATDL